MTNRLQKKCFIASTGFHLFLLMILLFGSAFLSSDKPRPDLQMLDVIPVKIIEAPFVGGGSPNVKPPPPADQPQPPEPTPVTQPTPPPLKQDEAPPKPEPKVVTRDRDALDNEKPTKADKPKINLKTVTRPKNGETAKNSSTNKTSDSKETSKEIAALQSALRSLKQNLSSATEVGIQGPGGEAYAGYENVIQSIYQHRYDQELLTAGDVGTQVVEVEVEVIIARSGSVLSARLTKPSGNAAMNRVVQRVLERVGYIAPFPEGAKDSQRTFNIIFELKPKKAIG